MEACHDCRGFNLSELVITDEEFFLEPEEGEIIDEPMRVQIVKAMAHNLTKGSVQVLHQNVNIWLRQIKSG